MSDHPLVCQSDYRRVQVRAKGRNGIDYIEVSGKPPALTVYFLEKAPPTLTIANIRITGGRRVRDLRAVGLSACVQEDEERDDCLTIALNKPGDLSTYRLCFVEGGKPADQPMAGFDPRYACLDFSFRANCPSDLDCGPGAICPSEPRVEPEINYLAKDYASFRQLILDRLALLIPDWQERHVPDLGITLVELLAYAGDHLSYYQDAVATEAYLDTARRRISVRRHARLVDYFLHEGCNARAWVCVEVEAGAGQVTLDPNDAYFVTGHANAQAIGRSVLSENDLQQAVAAGQYDVFEALPCQPIDLYEKHNTLRFYTWGDSECCLPKGATRATLRYDWQAPPPAPAGNASQTPVQVLTGTSKAPVPSPTPPEERKWLQAGDVLIFEEVKGPKTGDPDDADPLHRHAVRLTDVEYVIDDLYDPPVQLVEIEWAAEDALPFPLCLSAVVPPGCELAEDISVARGNVILVDHGRSVEEDLPAVPTPAPPMPACEGEGRPRDPLPPVVRFDPKLARSPLSHSVPLMPKDPGAEDRRLPSAYALMQQDPHAALPVICLSEARSDGADGESQHGLLRAGCLCGSAAERASCWLPKRDLLESDPEDRHFVAEIENEGRAHLRFGDGELGRAPQAGGQYRAHYRVGNGVSGNVGSGALTRLVYRRLMIAGVSALRNPLPARGGVDPEPLAEAKLYAPQAFRKQLQRAITADDYARLTERNSGVQRAAGSLHWTGSWYEMQVTLDPLGAEAATEALLDEIDGGLHIYRRIGHDVTVAAARYVPLELELRVCVKPHYLRGHVKAALLDVFSNRNLPGGRRGFFHPDNLTFGEGIYLSELVALAQSVPGVEHVEVKALKRLNETSSAAAQAVLYDGVLKLGPLEVAQLDYDPAQPENGKLILDDVRGGR